MLDSDSHKPDEMLVAVKTSPKAPITKKKLLWDFAALMTFYLVLLVVVAGVWSYCWNNLTVVEGLPVLDFANAFTIALIVRLLAFIITLK